MRDYWVQAVFIDLFNSDLFNKLEWVTSTHAPSPTGRSTSRLVSSSRWRKISKVLRHRHKTENRGRGSGTGCFHIFQYFGLSIYVKRAEMNVSLECWKFQKVEILLAWWLLPDFLDIPVMFFFFLHELMSFLRARNSQMSCMKMKMHSLFYTAWFVNDLDSLCVHFRCYTACQR